MLNYPELIKREFVARQAAKFCMKLFTEYHDLAKQLFGNIDNCIRIAQKIAEKRFEVWYSNWAPNWACGLIRRMYSTYMYSIYSW